jgi:hypothetical protein
MNDEERRKPIEWLAWESLCNGHRGNRRLGLGKSVGFFEPWLAVRFGCGAIARDVPSLTTFVANFPRCVQGAAIGSGAIARDVALISLVDVP